MNTVADDDFSAAPTPEAEPPSKAKRGPGRRWQPGVSGNPSGKPKQPERLKKAIDDGSVEGAEWMLASLRDARTSKEIKYRVAQYFIDRKLGRPTAPVTGADGAALFPAGAPAADNAITRLVAAVVARRTAATNGEAPGTADPPNAPQGSNGEATEPVS